MKRPSRKYKPYPSDVSDEEWSFVAPCLTLSRLDSKHREHDLRAVFNALRWSARSGASWRMMPHGQSVELAYADQGYTAKAPEQAAQTHGIQLEVVKHTEAKRGFVLLPRRWVVERSFARAARFRRVARDYERLAQTLARFHYPASVRFPRSLALNSRFTPPLRPTPSPPCRNGQSRT